MHMCSPTDGVYLVGELDWVDSRRLFWFTAHGDRIDDGHLLQFDGAVALGPQAISFLRDGQAVAHLTSIASAAVDDVEDYAVAFSLWHQTAPACHKLIDEAREFALTTAGSSADDGRIDAALISSPPKNSAPATMSDPEIDALVTEVRRGVITVKTALSLLAINGIDRSAAAKLVFQALGGSDATEVDSEGRTRYVGSGKLVSEVEHRISAGIGDVAASA